MIIKQYTVDSFRSEFYNYNRGGQFSYEALEVLYNLLEEESEAIGEPVFLDVISLCCDFTEYESLNEALKELGLEDLESLEDATLTYELSTGSILIQNYQTY